MVVYTFSSILPNFQYRLQKFNNTLFIGNPHLNKMRRMEGYDKVYNQRNTGSTEGVPKESRVPRLFA